MKYYHISQNEKQIDALCTSFGTYSLEAEDRRACSRRSNTEEIIELDTTDWGCRIDLEMPRVGDTGNREGFVYKNLVCHLTRRISLESDPQLDPRSTSPATAIRYFFTDINV